MKKVLKLLVVVGVLISSCTNKSPESKIITECKESFDKEVLPNLKDPKSFEEISIKFVDTMYKLDELKEDVEDIKEGKTITESVIKSSESLINTLKRYDDTNEFYKKELTMLKEYEELGLRYQKEIDSLNNLINITPKNIVEYYRLEYKFRAKNGFGALDIFKYKVIYYPSRNGENKSIIKFRF